MSEKYPRIDYETAIFQFGNKPVGDVELLTAKVEIQFIRAVR